MIIVYIPFVLCSVSAGGRYHHHTRKYRPNDIRCSSLYCDVLAGRPRGQQ